MGDWRMSDPSVYRSAALALAHACNRAVDELTYWRGDAAPWLPPEVLKLSPNYVAIRKSGARVEFGGGFLHFGYLLFREPYGTGPGDDWSLFIYQETRRKCVYRFATTRSKF